ncbi:trypsin-like peptidase domain-containing protein, partial [Pseudomonas aeruginosa]
MHTLKRRMAATVASLALSLAMTPRADLPDFTPLAEQASSVLVNISTRQTLQDRAMSRGQLSIHDLEVLPPMFRDFLERRIPQVPRNPRGQQHEAQALGYGVIISNDGYILTNNHVVADADEILVRLSDRREHKVTLGGADPRRDVTLLKIEAEHMP